ncbi:MAG: hypothetical protein V9E83_00265 [Baekduia sp.]
MAAGVVHIPFYATVFRGDELAEALAEIAPSARPYGATSWTVHRQLEDAYSLRLIVSFDDKKQWELWWDGPEMRTFRARHVGMFQIPLLYNWCTVVTAGPDGAVVAETEAPEQVTDDSEAETTPAEDAASAAGTA